MSYIKFDVLNIIFDILSISFDDCKFFGTWHLFRDGLQFSNNTCEAGRHGDNS